jgi:hypothetical protein
MIDLPPHAEAIWGDDATEEPDGTFSVTAWYLDGGKIMGLPSKRVALEVLYALSTAFDKGAESASYY